MSLYKHVPHPRVQQRETDAPVTVAAQHGDGINARLAARGTRLFGSMPTFYVFVIYGALGAVFVAAQNKLLYWSNWIQLWSLPLLMVGGIVLGKASDKRAQQTFDDTTAILHEVQQIQEHQAAQDAVLERLDRR